MQCVFTEFICEHAIMVSFTHSKLALINLGRGWGLGAFLVSRFNFRFVVCKDAKLIDPDAHPFNMEFGNHSRVDNIEGEFFFLFFTFLVQKVNAIVHNVIMRFYINIKTIIPTINRDAIGVLSHTNTCVYAHTCLCEKMCVNIKRNRF